MILQFTKMHGCGNDFIVIDGIHQDLSQISTAQWQFLADRHFGIGADQILLVENSSSRMSILNTALLITMVLKSSSVAMARVVSCDL